MMPADQDPQFFYIWKYTTELAVYKKFSVKNLQSIQCVLIWASVLYFIWAYSSHKMIEPEVNLFDLILYVRSRIFQLNMDVSSWEKPVLS